MTGEPDIELIVRIVLRVLDELGPRPASPVTAPRSRSLVTEHDVVAAIPAGRLEVPPGAVITPLARDTAAEKGVAFVEVGA